MRSTAIGRGQGSLHRRALMVLGIFISAVLSGCGVNNIPTYEQSAKAKWADVQSAYQRRSDLIPNLVETVKAFATQENKVLVEVVEARAKATATTAQIKLPEGAAPSIDQMKQIQGAQNELSGALSRLLVSVERYPELKSQQNFIQLQSQLEGTENRINIVRSDYNDAVRRYNTELVTIPGRWWRSLMYGDKKEMAFFEAAAGSQAAPKVDFGTKK
jgi:LemA protein